MATRAAVPRSSSLPLLVPSVLFPHLRPPSSLRPSSPPSFLQSATLPAIVAAGGRRARRALRSGWPCASRNRRTTTRSAAARAPGARPDAARRPARRGARRRSSRSARRTRTRPRLRRCRGTSQRRRGAPAAKLRAVANCVERVARECLVVAIRACSNRRSTSLRPAVDVPARGRGHRAAGRRTASPSTIPTRPRRATQCGLRRPARGARVRGAGPRPRRELDAAHGEQAAASAITSMPSRGPRGQTHSARRPGASRRSRADRPSRPPASRRHATRAATAAGSSAPE